MPLGAIDTQAFTWNVDDFQGGLNSYFPPNKIGEEFLTKAQNALIEEDGVLRRRPGITRIGTYPTTVITRKTGLAILVAGAGASRKIYTLAASATLPSLTYFAFWDGTSWSQTTYDIFNSVEEASLCWVRHGDSSEHVWTVSPEIASVIAVQADVGVGVTPTKTDLGTANTSPIGNGRSIINFQDRIWIGGVNTVAGRDLVFYSSVSAQFAGNEVFDRTIYVLPFGTVRGEDVTALAIFRENMMVVGQRSSLNLVAIGTGAAFLDWQQFKISDHIGIGGSKTVANANEDVLFMDQDGEIRSLQATLGQTGTYVVGPPISLPIRDETNQIDASELFRANMAFHQGNLWYSFLRSDGAWRIFVFNAATRRWTGPMVFKNAAGDELQVHAMTSAFGDPGTSDVGNRAQHLYFLCSDGTKVEVYELDDAATNDDGATAIDFDCISKAHDFGLPHQDKELDWIELTYKTVSGTSGLLTIEARTDFGDWVEVAHIEYVGGHTLEWRKVPVRRLGYGRTFQFRFRSTTAAGPEIVRFVIHGRPAALEAA